ncbi:catecholate siderophore receptor Fiu [Massilia sp. G4R7]|uniref:Catecholate siderophore receptor Fiu n=1 Tax=Massilia phyllostachyos TaxID=2898585 RepID=A0ABS8Q4E1_9BURK|nr:catecholate siderophore receptor Fiu [Massilia phyllostachyos]MCD2515932.1 catecholate siderophore receptor Fiu [Massilia phyllostachyos]
MKTIKSRKHPQPHVMGAALAAVLLPLAAHAADADKPAPEIQSSAKVEIVGKTENAFKAEHASSAKYTEKLLDTAQTVQVIKKELFEQQGAVTLTEALRNTPGVGAFFLGENGNTNTGDAIFMRGFDTSGSIFVDGARDIGSISRDTFNLEQIDVLKGPAGTDTGRGSPTGSINLVSKKANMSSNMSGSVLGGTDSQKRATVDVNTVLNAERGIALRLNAMAQDSDTPGRNVVNNKRWAVAPSLGFGLNGQTRVYLDYLHVDQDNTPDGGVPTIGLPGYTSPDPTRAFLTNAAPVNPENFYGSNSDFDKVKADMATIRVEHEFAPNMRLSNVSRYGRTSQDYVLTAWLASTANFRTPVVADPSTWTVARSTRTSKDAENKILTNQTTLTADFNTGDVAHTIVTGLEFVNETQATYGRTGLGTLQPANLYNPNPADAVTGQALARTGAYNEGDIDTQSLFLFDTMKFGEKWIFNGGVRVDRFRGTYNAVALTNNVLVPTRINVGDTLVNGKASLLYKPTTNSSVYGMVATSKQPPGANFTASTSASSAQNPIFDPQETTTYELGAKVDLLRQKLALSAALFRTDVKNEVEQDPVDLKWYQTGKKRVQGVELGVTGALSSNWLVSAGYLYMDNTVEAGRAITASGENSLTYTPKSSFTLWTSYDVTPSFKVGGGARYSDELKRGTDGAVGTPKYTEDYWVFDLMASYRISPNLDLRLNVYNVADEEYVASINKSGYRYTPGAARSASLTANFRF